MCVPFLSCKGGVEVLDAEANECVCVMGRIREEGADGACACPDSRWEVGGLCLPRTGGFDGVGQAALCRSFRGGGCGRGGRGGVRGAGPVRDILHIRFPRRISMPRTVQAPADMQRGTPSPPAKPIHLRCTMQRRPNPPRQPLSTPATGIKTSPVPPSCRPLSSCRSQALLGNALTRSSASPSLPVVPKRRLGMRSREAPLRPIIVIPEFSSRAREIQITETKVIARDENVRNPPQPVINSAKTHPINFFSKNRRNHPF